MHQLLKIFDKFMSDIMVINGNKALFFLPIGIQQSIQYLLNEYFLIILSRIVHRHRQAQHTEADKIVFFNQLLIFIMCQLIGKGFVPNLLFNR